MKKILTAVLLSLTSAVFATDTNDGVEYLVTQQITLNSIADVTVTSATVTDRLISEGATYMGAEVSRSTHSEDGDLSLHGSAAVGNDLSVVDASTLSGSLDVDGQSSFGADNHKSTMTIDGVLTLHSGIVASTANFTGNNGQYGLTVTSGVSLGGLIYTNNGNVGIGFASPTAPLTIAKAAGTPLKVCRGTNEDHCASFGMGGSANDDLVMSLTGSGNISMSGTKLSIGAGTSPVSKLHISSSVITNDGTGAVPTSFAVCFSTGGAMGHCVTGVDAAGNCSCQTP